jgi:hypothetical protein
MSNLASPRSNIWPALLPILLFVLLISAANARAPSDATTKTKASRTLPLTAFYETPTPLPPGKPGELIRSEPFYQYQLPPEISTVRILYHSRSGRGEDVAVSGLVLFPNKVPPAGGWPIIAWAHAYSGSGRECAPSLMKNVFDGPFLSMYVALGYAVVASDYAGLGTSVPSAPLDIRSTAADVAASVVAAYAAVPPLGRQWLAMGTLQGALTAAAVGELENDSRDPNYLGAMAISGVADPTDIYSRLAAGRAEELLLGLTHSIEGVYPQLSLSHVLTPQGVAVYQSRGPGCPGTGRSLKISADPLVEPGWVSDPVVREFLERNTLGSKPAFGPVLVIASDDDTLTPVAMTAKSVSRMCRQKDRIQFNRYSGLDAGGELGATIRDQMTWIEERLAGRAAPTNCP